MPVYLLHGFRWPRPLIRIHIILQNLDDAAAEWLVSPGTTKCLLDNFHTLFPDQMRHLPNLRFVEQFDPTDESTDSNAPSQPFAYVADVCVEVKLGVNVDEFRAKGATGDQWQALMELRDKIAPEERPGWFVVVCGDEERWAPPTIETLDQSARGLQTNAAPADGEPAPRHSRSDPQLAQSAPAPSSSSNTAVLDNGLVATERKKKGENKTDEHRSFRKLLGGFSRRKSHAALPNRSQKHEDPSPPLPASTPAESAPQLPSVSLSSLSRPSPSVITNDNLVAEVNGDARTLIGPPSDQQLAELSTVPPTRDGESRSRSRSIETIAEEAYATPDTEYSDSDRQARSMHRRSDVPNFKSLSKDSAMLLGSGQQSTATSRSQTKRASLPPPRMGHIEEYFQDRFKTLNNPLAAPSPAVAGSPVKMQRTTRRHSLQKPSPEMIARRGSMMPKIDTTPPLTETQVAANDQDDGECLVISMQPRSGISTANLSMRQSQYGDRVVRPSSQQDGPSSHSPVKCTTSPETYRPKSGRFPVVPSPPRSVSTTLVKAERPVFGQGLTGFDLVANNLENALSQMR